MSAFNQSNTPNFKHVPTVPTEPIWRFSVNQYHQMIALGILTEDDPVELLEGWIIYKMPKKPPHRVATKLTRNALEKIVPEGWYVDAQEPITLENSEPEPDVVIVRGNTRDYLERHPAANEIALVIEIADSTLERDRTIKKRLYARAMIPIYWIINLSERQLEVYSNPVSLVDEPTYQQCARYSAVVRRSLLALRQDYQLSDRVPVTIEEDGIGFLLVQDLLL